MLTTLTVTLLSLTLAAPETSSENDILAGAEARILKHRTAEAVLQIKLDADEPIKGGEPVHIEQTKHAFLFGCNIYSLYGRGTEGANQAYGRHFAELFNYATLPFYWWAYEKEQGKPDYRSTERVLRWCEMNNVIPKGHPLAWNYVDPSWLPDDPKTIIDLQMKRITDCMKRFKDEILIWDVVNEATIPVRPDLREQSPKLTAAIMEMGVGPYVRRAFRTARKANPDATLLINDYHLGPEYGTNVIKELVDEDGQPLYDVIGLQSHQHRKPIPIEDLWGVCEYFARFDKPLHWTENTFLSGQEGWELTKTRPEGWVWESTAEGEKRQAELARKFYTVLFSHPAVEAITWWDFGDKKAWMHAPAGLLRRDMTPKPAYQTLMKLIKDEWWTRTQATSSATGMVRFRGFLGSYRITVGQGEHEKVGEFTLARDRTAPIEVILR